MLHVLRHRARGTRLWHPTSPVRLRVLKPAQWSLCLKSEAATELPAPSELKLTHLLALSGSTSMNSKADDYPLTKT